MAPSLRFPSVSRLRAPLALLSRSRTNAESCTPLTPFVAGAGIVPSEPVARPKRGARRSRPSRRGRSGSIVGRLLCCGCGALPVCSSPSSSPQRLELEALPQRTCELRHAWASLECNEPLGSSHRGQQETTWRRDVGDAAHSGPHNDSRLARLRLEAEALALLEDLPPAGSTSSPSKPSNLEHSAALVSSCASTCASCARPEGGGAQSELAADGLPVPAAPSPPRDAPEDKRKLRPRPKAKAPPPPPRATRIGAAGAPVQSSSSAEAGDAAVHRPTLPQWRGPAPPPGWRSERVVNWQPIRQSGRWEGSVWEQVYANLQQGSFDLLPSSDLNMAFLRGPDDQGRSNRRCDGATGAESTAPARRILSGGLSLSADLRYAQLVRLGFRTAESLQWAIGHDGATAQLVASAPELPEEALEALHDLLVAADGYEGQLLESGQRVEDSQLVSSEALVRDVLLTAGPLKSVLARVSLALSMARFPAEAGSAEAHVQAGINAIKAVRSSSMLPKLLEGILLLGNYLNAGSRALSGAVGVTLESLAKLAHTKPRPGADSVNSNALSIIMGHLMQRHGPELLCSLLRDLDGCRSGRDLDPMAMEQAVERLRNQIRAVETRSRSEGDCDCPTLAPALQRTRLLTFLEGAAPRVRALESLVAELDTETLQLQRHFAEPKETSLADMIRSLASLADALALIRPPEPKLEIPASPAFEAPLTPAFQKFTFPGKLHDTPGLSDSAGEARRGMGGRGSCRSLPPRRPQVEVGAKPRHGSAPARWRVPKAKAKLPASGSKRRARSKSVSRRMKRSTDAMPSARRSLEASEGSLDASAMSQSCDATENGSPAGFPGPASLGEVRRSTRRAATVSEMVPVAAKGPSLESRLEQRCGIAPPLFVFRLDADDEDEPSAAASGTESRGGRLARQMSSASLDLSYEALGANFGLLAAEAAAVVHGLPGTPARSLTTPTRGGLLEAPPAPRAGFCVAKEIDECSAADASTSAGLTFGRRDEDSFTIDQSLTFLMDESLGNLQSEGLVMGSGARAQTTPQDKASQESSRCKKNSPEAAVEKSERQAKKKVHDPEKSQVPEAPKSARRSTSARRHRPALAEDPAVAAPAVCLTKVPRRKSGAALCPSEGVTVRERICIVTTACAAEGGDGKAVAHRKPQFIGSL